MGLSAWALAAAVAAAPAAAPAPDRFELTLAGAKLGVEEVVRTATESGTTLAGEVRLALPDGSEGTLRQEARLAKDGSPTAYALDVDVRDQQLAINAAPAESGFLVTVVPKGMTEPVASQTVATVAPVFLLDNSFASHLDVVTRSIQNLADGGERSFQALVPQVLKSVPGTIRRLADVKVTLDQTPIAARTYRLTLANLAVELTARAADGALLEAKVPMQKLVIRRAGYAPAAAAGAAADGPTPSDPREAATSVSGPAGALPATLLLPKSERSVPGVVLLAGSGPNDRDETIGPNKPFADLARGLGDRGIASLRFDKRTHALKDKAEATLAAEYYEDAAAAIKMLATTAGVDPAKIFLVGHSEGAMVAPRIASAAGGVRGLVLMAPAVRPMDEVILDQMAYGAKLMGLDAAAIAEQNKLIEEQFAQVKDPKSTVDPKVLGAPAAYWRELIALDVIGAVKSSKLPVLVLQGDKDFQVRKDLDFGALRTAVGDASGRVAYKSFPDLNHLFMKVDGTSSGAEYGVPGRVDPAVPAAVSEWILKH